MLKKSTRGFPVVRQHRRVLLARFDTGKVRRHLAIRGARERCCGHRGGRQREHLNLFFRRLLLLGLRLFCRVVVFGRRCVLRVLRVRVLRVLRRVRCVLRVLCVRVLRVLRCVRCVLRLLAAVRRGFVQSNVLRNHCVRLLRRHSV